MAAPTIPSAVKYRTRDHCCCGVDDPPTPRPIRLVLLCCLILERKKADWVSALFKVPPPQVSILEQVDGDKGLFLKHLDSLFEKSACVVPSLSPAYQICVQVSGESSLQTH